MKKIYSLSLLLLGLLVLGSCSDDNDNPYAGGSSITVVKSDLNFDAAASEGSIVYASAGTVTATVSASWCKAVVDGDSVKVTVTQNNTRNGRAASVTLHQGTDSLTLAVLQQGVVINAEKTCVSLDNDEAASLRYSFVGNIDVSVLSCPDWATASIANDSLYVDVTANATGHLRNGYIVYGSGSYTDSIRVFQADFDKDIAGTYTIYYEKSEDDPTQIAMRNKELTSTSLYVLRTLSLPITYDSENCALVVTSGSYLGTNISSNTTYQVYLAFGLPDGYWTGYYSGQEISAELTYNDVDGTCAEFKGSVSDYEFVSLLFRRFTSKNFSEDYDAGTNVYRMIRPVIKRAPVEAATQTIPAYIARR